MENFLARALAISFALTPSIASAEQVRILTGSERVVDPGSLMTIASIIAAFGASMLMFRIQRELHMGGRGEIIWLPIADWLLVAATLICLLLVVVPLTFSSATKFPAACAAASSIMVSGYVFAILAHYRIIFDRKWALWGQKQMGPRRNPEPAELIFVVFTLVAALAVFLVRFILDYSC